MLLDTEIHIFTKLVWMKYVESAKYDKYKEIPPLLIDGNNDVDYDLFLIWMIWLKLIRFSEKSNKMHIV